MGDTTEISWCDSTFNPWMGCTKVSPACAACYAKRDMEDRYGKVTWGPNGTRVITVDSNWRKPVKWNRDAEINRDAHSDYLLYCDHRGIKPREPQGEYHRPRVFCASLADIFEDWHGPMMSNRKLPLWKCCCGNWFDTESQGAPCTKCGDLRASMVTMGDARRRLFKLIDATPNLDWLILTKRPENIDEMWPCKNDTNGDGDCHVCVRASNAPCRYRHNVWLGASVENQEYAEKRIPELLKCMDLSPVLFLSCEPLLGPVDFARIWNGCDFDPDFDVKIDWVIAGGESGPDARPTDPDWFRLIRDQCETAEVPFHFKQWGEWNQAGVRVGKATAGRVLDCRTHDAFPQAKSAKR